MFIFVQDVIYFFHYETVEIELHVVEKEEEKFYRL